MAARPPRLVDSANMPSNLSKKPLTKVSPVNAGWRQIYWMLSAATAVASSASSVAAHSVALTFDDLPVFGRFDSAAQGYVVRCDPGELADRAGVRVEEPTGKSNVQASFGSLTIPRAFLELNHRRIGPRSLATSNYHRLHWMNLLLPYCAESLELLVDTCLSCDTKLGWRFARGIGNCEACGEVVPPSTVPGLPQDLADDYRLFARLSSPHAAAVVDAQSNLPQALQTVSPDGLVNLALQLGMIATGATQKAASRMSMATMAPDKLATSAAVGAKFLRTFPAALRDWVREADEGFGEDIAATANLRTRFRFLIGRHAQPDIRAILKNALPNIARYASHGLVTTKPYYLYTEVRRRLAFDNNQMANFKNCPDVVARHLSAPAKRQLTQYDADYIDGLASVIKGASSARSLRQRLHLPFYGVEQLCIEELVEVETHFIMGIASNQLHVRDASVDDLLSRIHAAAAREAPPAKCLKLTSATNRIGGGLKPWAGIVKAMLCGEVPFWMANRDGNFGDIMVRPNDLAPFRRVPVELRKLPGGMCQDFCQEDAAEILNIKACQIARLSSEFGLCLEKSGRRQAISRCGVLRVASCVAWPGEIGWHLGVKPQKVRYLMREEGIASIALGWDRRQLQAAGILPM